jgi:hypothetical protein
MKGVKSKILLITTLILSACYPSAYQYGDEADIVITKHDTAFDFTTLNTFALPDEVVKITGNVLEGDNIEFVDHDYADVILESIRNNMTDAGWVEVDEEGDPDVIILPSALRTTEVYWYYDYGYWDWYYPYDSWGWYYPYPIASSGYSTGSLFIQMTYPDGITAADNVPVLWTAIGNGLLDGDTAAAQERISNTIDQAFTQSAYLTLNQ